MSIVLKASVDPAEPLLHHRKALIRSEREREWREALIYAQYQH